MKRAVLVLGMMMLLLTSCESDHVKLFTRIIRHAAPDYAIDNTYFEELGCFSSTDCLPESLKALDPAIEFIYEPDVVLGGLTPNYPIALAWSRGMKKVLPSYMYSEVCMMPMIVRYLVAVDGEIQLVDSIEGLSELYTPIDTPEEAISFASAATGFSTLFELRKTPLTRYYVNKLDETYAELVDGGYRVQLFDTQMCGCGPHIIESIEVVVSQDGEVEVGERTPAYRDITNDGLCID